MAVSGRRAARTGVGADVAGGGDGLVADVGVGLRRDGETTLSLEVPLRVAPGTVTALLGPNGAGKTTVLRALAGLVPLDRGAVVLDGATLDDPASGAFVPAHERGARMVFSDHLLLPHLSALENVAFTLRCAGAPRRAARGLAREVMVALGVDHLAAAAPASLSGGQAQRVALARALVGERALLLLDEPLAALDAATRALVRTVLHERAGSSPTVLVTHDPLDALVLADDLVVLERGAVVQAGTPAAVARAPRTDYVASLVGLNLLRGRAEGSGGPAGSTSTVALEGGGSLTAAADVGDGGRGAVGGGAAVLVAFAPTAVSLHRQRPEGSARNVWPVRVQALERRGDLVRAALSGQPPVLADVTAAAVAALGLVEGAGLWAAVKATEVSAYPA